MKYKQKTYTTRVWDPFKREWIYSEVPTPEYVPDYSGLIEGTKSLSLFVMAAVLVFRVMGVL